MPLQVIGFSSETVAAFIGVVGILSILAQVRTSILQSLGNYAHKHPSYEMNPSARTHTQC